MFLKKKLTTAFILKLLYGFYLLRKFKCCSRKLQFTICYPYSRMHSLLYKNFHCSTLYSRVFLLFSLKKGKICLLELPPEEFLCIVELCISQKALWPLLYNEKYLLYINNILIDDIWREEKLDSKTRNITSAMT